MPSTAKPGFGSAILATPVGVSGESRNATTTAIALPTRPIALARIIPSAKSWEGETPSERRVGCSVDSRKVWRARACPKIARPVRATSAASTHSAMAWGCVA